MVMQFYVVVVWAMSDLLRNSIAFGSAPRREVDSHPITPVARPAVSHTEIHSLGFLSVADVAPSSGESHNLRTSSGRMVIQLTLPFLVGDSDPGKVNKASPAAPPTVGQDSNRRLKTLRPLSVITIRPPVVRQQSASPLLGAF